MPRGSTELITFKADISDLTDKLKGLPGITDKEAKSMVKALARQLKKTEKAASKAAKKNASSFDKMAKSADQTKESFGRLGAAAGKISPSIGGLVTGLGDMLGVAGALTNPVGAVAAGVVGLGIVTTAGAAGVAALVAGMAAATLAADELIEELEKFGDFDGVLPPLSDAEIAGIERANAAVESLGLALKTSVTMVGAEFAPVMEVAATRALAVALAVLDARDGIEGLGEGAINAARRVLDFVQALDQIAEVVALVPGMNGVATAMEMAAVGADALELSIDALVDVSDPYVDDAERMISAVQRIGNEATTTANAVDEMAVALAANQQLYGMLATTIPGVAGEVLKLELAYSKQVEQIDKLIATGGDAEMAAQTRAALEKQLVAETAQLYRDFHAERAQQIHDTESAAIAASEAIAAQERADAKEAQKRREAARDAEIAASTLMLETQLQAGSDVANATATITGLIADKMAENGQEGALMMYRISQASALTQIGIDTAAGIMRAYASLPTPLALGASVGIGALGIAQAAVVASQPPPQVAHTGAMVGMGAIAGGAGLGPDERMVRARIGEGILTPSAVRSVGGADGVAALNSGVNMRQPIVVNQVYRGRVLDTAIQDQLGRTSALRRATAGTRPRGRRNFYNGAL
jgi:hypothetical protein